MAPHDITEFLLEQTTGVLSLAQDGEAYGIPMSYAYDKEAHRLIMDLAFAEESKKRSFIASTTFVCFTIYEWEAPDHWRSVVVSGPFEQISSSETTSDLDSWYQRVAADIDVSEGISDLQWYVLTPTEISGVARSPSS